jgi:ketosteroid isomerase-like protein
VGSTNVDVVRSIYSAWERGDYSCAEWADPEIEYVFADGPDPGTRKGLAGVVEGVRAWLSAWDEFSFTAEEFRALDGERVLVLNRFGGRGKVSGLDVGQTSAKGAHVFHLRGGKVTRIVQYLARDPVAAL